MSQSPRGTLAHQSHPIGSIPQFRGPQSYPSLGFGLLHDPLVTARAGYHRHHR